MISTYGEDFETLALTPWLTSLGFSSSSSPTLSAKMISLRSSVTGATPVVDPSLKVVCISILLVATQAAAVAGTDATTLLTPAAAAPIALTLANLTMIISTLSTTLPTKAGVLWLNGSVLQIS